ncbi:hypothetical protein [Donghicola sp. XS_ASV15]|uniref:hypothetical protein n=1 Tax=Donghicola sp. XS_ASV15 TaxID=3241295 RepID=UPI003513A1FC
MDFTCSDFFGVLAGIFFALPAIRDQFIRYKLKRLGRGLPENDSLKILYGNIKEATHERRSDFSSVDSTLLFFGSLFLITSYLL